jgi:hypothetical protein
VYNGSYAPANGLPRLKDRAVVGLEFTLIGGFSLVRRNQPQTEVQSVVVGVTDYGGALAAIAPIEAVAWLEKEMGIDQPGRLSSAMLKLAPGADAVAVSRAVRDLGWSIEEIGTPVRQLSVALRTANMAIAAVGGVLAGTTVLLLAQIYGVLLRERRADLAILRGLGASRRFIGSALVAELAGASFASAAAGTVLGLMLGGILAPTLAVRIGDLLGTSVTLTAFPPGMLLVGIGLGAPLVAVLAAAPAIMSAVLKTN